MPLVLLEGGEGKLDSLFFRSFPNAAQKEKILRDYLARGELTGAETASIFKEEQTAEYYGIENQAIYNENKKAFLEALQNESALSRYLVRLESEFERKEGSIFS